MGCMHGKNIYSHFVDSEQCAPHPSDVFLVLSEGILRLLIPYLSFLILGLGRSSAGSKISSTPPLESLIISTPVSSL